MTSLSATLSKSAAAILADIGIEIGAGGIVIMSDMHKAERAYIHHSTTPVAITAFSVVSPAFAKGRYPKTTLRAVVLKRPSMDWPEAIALAAVCGSALEQSLEINRAPAFIQQLYHVIAQHELGEFFRRDAVHPAMNEIDIRPTAVNHGTGEIDPAAMAAWRSAFRTLPLDRRILAATILWLYCGEHDETWIKGLQYRWHAADAVDTLKSAGCLADWGKLVALYPGW